MNGLGSEGTRQDTEDTTMIVQIEEVMCVIRSLPFVTNGHGYQVSLRCSYSEQYVVERNKNH